MSNLSRGGSLIYKCRLCGETSSMIHAPDAPLAVLYLMRDIALPKEWGGMPIGKTERHYCREGQVGVSDLIGAKLDAEKS